MNFINNIEQRLEKAVRSTFAKGGSEFEPVDIANQLRTELDNKAYSIASGRTLAPNIFTIRFAAADYSRVQQWGAPLAEELCDVVIRHARAQGYTLRGSVRVTFLVDRVLEQGQYEIDSTQESNSAQTAGSIQDRTGRSIPTRTQRNAETVAIPAPIQPKIPAQQAVLEINGQNYSLRSLPVVLGRGSQADITVDDTGVSRRHLEITEQDGIYLAVDLGSTNGSYHNGHKLIGRRELTNGDVLTVGRARIVFRLMVPREAQ